MLYVGMPLRLTSVFLAAPLFLLAGCASKAPPPQTGGAGGMSESPAGGMSASGGGSEATGGGSSSGGASETGGTTSEGTGGSMADKKTFVYVGSGDWSGEPGLISVYELDRATLTLSLSSDHAAGGLASYLAIDAARLRLFAVDEANGGVRSYALDGETGALTSLGATASSNHPVYLWATGDGAFLLGANYNEGSVDVYPIDASGKAGASLGATPTGAQAHSVVMNEGGRVFVPNKGSSTISLLDFAAGTLTAAAPASVALASPRHLFLQGNRAYVVSEEADLITAFDVDAGGGLSPVWDVPRLPPGAGSAATDTGADVRVTPNGQFLYATNRGSSNTVVAYDLRTNPPTLLEHQSSRGTTPRNFAMDPRGEFLIVANHGTEKTLVIFTIGDDGRLTARAPLAVDFSPYFVTVVELP